MKERRGGGGKRRGGSEGEKGRGWKEEGVKRRGG